MVKSEKIYSTTSYCSEFLGFYPIPECKEDELREILDERGYDYLWDYPLTEIDHIVENKLDVVLVDTSYVDEKTHEIIPEYRWFQVETKED